MGTVMKQTIFRIRRSFLLPLGLVVLLTLALLLSCILLGLPLAKTIILGAFLLPVMILFAESICRRVRIDDRGVQVDKLFRSKRLNFTELTSIDTVRVRKRAFVSLSSEEDFVILSNSYAEFSRMLQLLLEHAPQPVISEETRQLADNPPEKSSDIFSAWLAVGILVLILYVQLKGAF